MADALQTLQTIANIGNDASKSTSAQISNGLDVGSTLAKAHSQIAQQKEQTELQHQQVIQGKVNGIQGLISTYLRAGHGSPIQKALEPQIKKGVASYGGDPTIIDGLKDQDLARQHVQAQNMMSAKPLDPAAQAQLLQSMGNLADYAPALSAYIQENRKQSFEMAKVGAEGQTKENVAEIMAGPGSMKAQRLGNTQHEASLKAVNNDQITNDLQTGYQNLNNALSNFQASGHNPEEFAQLQQSLRANAGIRGNSTGNERADSYLKSYGITAQEFLQKLSASPQDIAKTSPKFMKLVADVADAELTNKRTQAEGQLKRLAVGRRAIYSDGRPAASYKADFDATVASRAQQFGIDPNKVVPGYQGAAQASSGAPPAGVSTTLPEKPTPNQVIFIKKAQALKNPLDGSPYSAEQIAQMIKAKGIK